MLAHEISSAIGALSLSGILNPLQKRSRALNMTLWLGYEMDSLGIREFMRSLTT